MNCLKASGILYLIADFAQGEEPVRQALLAGVDIVQLREKNLSSAEYLRRAKRMRELTRQYPTIFVVNDRLDIALLSQADGVHLGQEDIPVGEARALMPHGLIGATAKTKEQAVKAQREGADYLGSGAWFPTQTKADAVPLARETYAEILAAVTIPDVAVGGITLENCGRPLECGASGLAVSAGILHAADIPGTIAGFRRRMS